ncbi:hypothetical protein B0I21_104291 [Sphingobacterium paludis]|uniref:Uncharacterized protein n=1 Tax=Sphingobacterium paludis TaxID=1476465 RepID=A0A4R7CZB9_9SPHI|nr:hypothetical protein B0I21_104291 [Sphingobacterium paludis]
MLTILLTLPFTVSRGQDTQNLIHLYNLMSLNIF